MNFVRDFRDTRLELRAPGYLAFHFFERHFNDLVSALLFPRFGQHVSQSCPRSLGPDSHLAHNRSKKMGEGGEVSEDDKSRNAN